MRVLLFAVAALALSAAPALAQQRIQPGQTVQGDLSDGDDRLDSGEFTDVYEIEGRAGQTLTATLRSDDFDAYLMVNGSNGFDEQNDDVAEGDTNSSLSIRLPADGPYYVIATSYEVGETGRYTFSLNLDGRGGDGDRGPSREEPPRQTPQAPSAAQPSGVAARFLEAHNVERHRVGAPPLVWSVRLEQASRGWARSLIDTDGFEHDSNAGAGENLWEGWGSRTFTPEEMVGDWISERAAYRPGVFPDVSRTGDWSDVGHYTQLIWSQTTEVGCAVESGGDKSVLVCRYSPSGNVHGSRP